jgi:hypothetical protein
MNNFKKAHDSARREVLYNILIGFGVTMTLVGLSKICFDEFYSKVCVYKICLIHFLFKMV